MPVEYEADGGTIHCRYDDGTKLVMRLGGFRGEGGWVVPGTCPVRFEGDDGWIETGDFGKIKTSAGSLLEGRPGQEMAGTDPAKHVREFIDCVKSRAKTASNADVMRRGHIACHAAAIAWKLGRKVRIDPVTETFIDDEEANRMRQWAKRAPWHV